MNSRRDPAETGCSWSSRLYESEHDLERMQDLLMKGRSRTDDWSYMHIGEFTFRFFMVACHLGPKEFIRLWHNADGELVGFAVLGEDPSIDWQVLPAYEWSGIESEAMEWAETRLFELRKHDPNQWNGELVSNARQDNGRRRAFLGQNGFRFSGEFAEVNMLRSLDEPIPGTWAAQGQPGPPNFWNGRRSQSGWQPIARYGCRGATAISTTRNMHASGGCPLSTATSTWSRSQRMGLSPLT